MYIMDLVFMFFTANCKLAKLWLKGKIVPRSSLDTVQSSVRICVHLFLWFPVIPTVYHLLLCNAAVGQQLFGVCLILARLNLVLSFVTYVQQMHRKAET